LSSLSRAMLHQSRLDVRTDHGPDAVHGRGFGVQHPASPFVYLHPRLQQIKIVRALGRHDKRSSLWLGSNRRTSTPRRAAASRHLPSPTLSTSAGMQKAQSQQLWCCSPAFYGVLHVNPDGSGSEWRLAIHNYTFIGVVTQNSFLVWAQRSYALCEAELGGVVAKLRASKYAGVFNDDWLKINYMSVHDFFIDGRVSNGNE
jgi:hypothetical protein